jgi:hypothetical protein
MKALFPLSSRVSWRRVWAVTRWVALGSVLPVLWACNSRTLEKPENHPVQVFNNVFKASINRQIDILFMIDNSQSMAPLQDKLLANFPVFMDTLKMIPTGDGTTTGLPDVHVAVISSDTGPGAYDLPDRHCAYAGDQGMFHSTPTGACTTPPLPADQHFLAAAQNQAVKNYTGDITDAFKCIALLGDQGCGFEGQLKSVRWALDPGYVPPGNEGFLRDEAFLAVILITNEDDCSVPDDSTLVDPSQELMSDSLGPLWSFRCNEFGHLCMQNGQLLPPPRGAVGQTPGLTGCVSNDDGPWPTNPGVRPTDRETRIPDEINFLKSLKADPNQILVAAITGPVTPYGIEMMSRTTSHGVTEDQPNTLHSCMQSSGEYADPAIRIQQWVQAFGAHGLLLPICAASFAPALSQIATELSKLLGPQCVTGTVRNRASGSPDCVVNDRYKNDQGKVIETPLPSCAENGGATPCWQLANDAKCAAGAKLLTVNRNPGDPVPNNLNTDVACALCTGAPGETGC